MQPRHRRSELPAERLARPEPSHLLQSRAEDRQPFTLTFDTALLPSTSPELNTLGPFIDNVSLLPIESPSSPQQEMLLSVWVRLAHAEIELH